MSRPQLEHRVDELAQNLALAQKHILYRNSVTEANTAQLVLQNLYLKRITEALYGKENTEPTTRSYFPKGHGRVLTDPQFVALLEADEAKKAAEKVAKARKSSMRDRRRAQKEENEMLWQEWLQEHDRKVAAWQVECTEARQAGTRVKDLPKRPKRPKRSDLPALPAVESDDDDVGELDDDDE